MDDRVPVLLEAHQFAVLDSQVIGLPLDPPGPVILGTLRGMDLNPTEEGTEAGRVQFQMLINLEQAERIASDIADILRKIQSGLN